MKHRCVFMDRDGVINVAPAPGGYVLRWEDVHFIPEAVDWIRLFRALGFLVIVVTNQRCVARGMISKEEIDLLHHRMCMEMEKLGAKIDDVYCCPHEEDDCACRKPEPGMILHAEHQWDIDLSQSILIGDTSRDRELAERTGLTFVEVAGGRILKVLEHGRE